MKRRKKSRLHYSKVLAFGLGLSAAASLSAWSATRRADLNETLLSGEATKTALGGPLATAGESTLAGQLVAGVTSSAVGALTWDLPVTRNARVDMWIAFLAGRNRAKTELWLERSGRYVPMMRAELRRRGMPEDLIYLAMIESGFSPNAYSTAKAAGLWQFIAETGQIYGLEVSPYIDERRDPVKATSAALDFLEKLHRRFGSWYLAAAAYNTGPNRVARILRERAGGARGDEDLFWRIAPYLPQETRDYVPLMLAAGHIAKDPAKYGFTDLEFHEPLEFEIVNAPGDVTLQTIATASGSSLKVIKELNPQLVRGRTPPRRIVQVRIPENSSVSFAEKLPALQLAALTAEKAAAKVAAKTVVKKKTALASRQKTHVVKKGESFSTIARKHGVSTAALQAANRKVKPKALMPGRVLLVPRARSS
jgi:membrane-bound lytic murein transglycosylase D